MAERVVRFTRTERTLHWIHAAGFFGLLGTGLVLYLPALSEAVGRRGLVKSVHLLVALAWMGGVLVVALAGDRRRLARTARELDAFDGDDRRWLRGRPAAQGRFNAGQKLHAVLQAAFAVLFVVSGALLWLGERNTAFRLGGTVLLHDGLTLVASCAVAGHLYLALVHPATRPALRGMVRGDVAADWARRHHAKWDEVPPAAD